MDNDRVCLLYAHQTDQSCRLDADGVCRQRSHRHCSLHSAMRMIAIDQADWIGENDGVMILRVKTKMQVIAQVKKRTQGADSDRRVWRKRISAGAGSPRVAVMQLVP